MDAFVEEIHAIRRRIAEEFGNDLHKIAASFRQLEAEHPERLAHDVPRTKPESQPAGAR